MRNVFFSFFCKWHISSTTWHNDKSLLVVLFDEKYFSNKTFQIFITKFFLLYSFVLRCDTIFFAFPSWNVFYLVDMFHSCDRLILNRYYRSNTRELTDTHIPNNNSRAKVGLIEFNYVDVICYEFCIFKCPWLSMYGV